ncbi:glycoside hydrolase family 16 protein [Flagellimonas hymeniacidonis]|uniref:Glycoside hydrolase family 16 protein n=1 Tax=Flagellimonas hymeniacidonis TaxID=2603628 RepID=A0A5C8VBS9_9FLAO|nr:glycoside hydrolase family 16 protein [Flagellimonas hymeniacidonis]TXN38268.1 glycoside hydrolase family 16 protein [Flagellimonas hymeniacidonis]
MFRIFKFYGLLLLSFMMMTLACSSNNGDIQLVDDETPVPQASCSDGIRNGDEDGVDCGGSNCEDCPTSLVIPESGYSTPESYTGYTLSWSDEFNGESLDSAKWDYHLGTGCPNLCGWGNNELQAFTDRGQNLYFEDGNLIMEAKSEFIFGQEYSSARIHTDNLFEFQYGRVDIRASMPSEAGTWVALFMLNKEYTIQDPGAFWPSGGEIDIMEYLGEDTNDILGTGHYGINFPANHHFNSVHFEALDGNSFNEVYYVFSIIWEEDKITWLVNDIEYHTMTPATTQANGQPYPFNDQFYFVFALSVGGNLPNVNPIASNFPAFLVVDYIRVFKANE